ncbi:MAG TPA: type I-F CRISPR-associated helicase Cas3 [Aeromonadales bacterium]|nr:type I-F CRISPR-associated helicase Cas3 [Aeromonadales bacterium]
MIVTFVSECEKKALNRTRRVLDAFANRIGSRSWQTVITQEGLKAVKKLLRKTATKNTAVSCHWIRSRRRSELLWVVGNKSKFNAQGYVPVNLTQKSIINTQWENDWCYLPLIKALTALAGLFHDWGKASEFFQYKLFEKKIIGDPYRHEWISLLFVSALCQGKTDQQWLEVLATGSLDFESLKENVAANKKPFQDLPDVALLLGWLIVTHHRLPTNDNKATNKTRDLSSQLRRIRVDWSYQNTKFDDFELQLKRCFEYPNGLPSEAKVWLREVKKWSGKLLDALPLAEQAIEGGYWRPIVQHCRLCLMLGDHYYSSLEPSSDKRVKHRELKLYANTDKHNKPKQTLDEHLLGVTKQALRTAHFLPVFEGMSFQGESVFYPADTPSALKQRSEDKKFRWQDKAVYAINRWRQQNKEVLDHQHFACFIVNMASTGMGKTFANAKIMRVLSEDGDSLRFILALGLRTLTLQTGDEYRNRIGLDKDELAVLIGSKAVQELHEQNQQDKNQSEDEDSGGSESSEPLLDNELDFEVNPHIEDMLKTVLQRPRDCQFLYAPVLACTIDHIMGATETIRGGKYILPTLRLMSSDLVIDEIDDFDGKDLIAIGRLIHLAGMLGRKVMISSATIPPDLAEGYFNAYQSGWALFAKTRDKNRTVGCIWVDEFKTQIDNVSASTETEFTEKYRQYHQQFIENRTAKLKSETIKRKAVIVPLQAEASDDTLDQFFYQTSQQAIIQQHKKHACQDEKTGKKISFGVVRLANISPCIELTRYLLAADWPDDIDIRAMAYHSQQVLIMRSEQEKHLDQVLKRKKGRQQALNHLLIRQHIEQSDAENLIFILVATPVEEVGRDHDFDWAVVEPSSFRSIIQLAGRVLRHQTLGKDIDEPNIALLQTNLRGLKGEKIAFTRPGYETSELKLESKALPEIIDARVMARRLDACPRIARPEQLQPTLRLADLEHEAIHRLLTNYQQQDAGSMQDWLSGNWWMTGMPQKRVRFRLSKGDEQINLYLMPMEGELKFCEKDKQGNPLPVEKVYVIKQENMLTVLQRQRLWLQRNYLDLLEQTGKATVEEAAQIYGELNLIRYSDTERYHYSNQLGLQRIKD